MTTTHAFFLGVLQGITEFFPVSSSGHLILAETFLHVRVDPLSMQGFNILLHAGTLLALLLCYAKQWRRIFLSPFHHEAAHSRLFLLLIIATIPGAVAGFLLEERIAAHLSSVSSVAFSFFVTAIILLLAERADQVHPMEQLTWLQVLFVGIAQACALVPGISRSGSTIAVARFFRIERKDALDFSFLLAAPIIAGATAVSLWQVLQGTILLPGKEVVFVGFLSSFIMSVLAIRFLRSFVQRHSFSCFAWYLVAMGAFLFTFGL